MTEEIRIFLTPLYANLFTYTHIVRKPLHLRPEFYKFPEKHGSDTPVHRHPFRAS